MDDSQAHSGLPPEELEESLSESLITSSNGSSPRKIEANSRPGDSARPNAETLRKDRSSLGQVNVAIRGGTFPMDGTGLYDVLHPDDGPEQSNGQIFDNDGWGHLMIVMEGDPKEIWSLLPYGESDDPSSPHYNDQTKLHSRREIKRFWFSPQEIRDHTESV